MGKDDPKEVAKPSGSLSIEEWKKAKATEAWLYNASKVFAKWSDSQIVSEAEYEAGLKAFLTIPMR